MVIFIVFLIVLSVFAIYYIMTNKRTAGPTTTEKSQRPTANRTKQSAANSIRVVIGLSEDKNVKIQNLRYFCIKDKGYHVSVWPKDYDQFDIVEFNIAGMMHRANIDSYLGEFVCRLESEPTNTYDPNAIKVLAPDGHHVGYVPADLTAEIRKEATLPCPCYCYIGSNNGTYFSDCFIPRSYADEPNVSPPKWKNVK